MSERTPTVVYGNDVLCGWCFATGPAILEAKRSLGDTVRWRIECGGLVTGERVRPIGLDRDYLIAGLERVEEVTGRQAGAGYRERVLDVGTWVSDSEPAARAVLTAQAMAEEVAVEFSHWLTDALYLEGRVPDDADVLRDAAAAVGIDGDELVARWATPDAVAATEKAFAGARAMGVTTYPSLFLEDGGELVPLLAGYAPGEVIESTIRAALVVSTAARR